MKNLEIDPKVKPLVDVVNKSGFLFTCSSCEGHDDLTKTPFHVRCEFDDLEKVKEFSGRIQEYYLKGDWHWAATLDVYNRYWITPNEGWKDIKQQLIIELVPFDDEVSVGTFYEAVNKLTSSAEKALGDMGCQ